MRGPSRWRSLRSPPGVEPCATPGSLGANPAHRRRAPYWDTLRSEVAQCARLAGQPEVAHALRYLGARAAEHGRRQDADRCRRRRLGGALQTVGRARKRHYEEHEMAEPPPRDFPSSPARTRSTTRTHSREGRVLPLERGVRAAGARRAGTSRRGRRLPLPVDLRPLPPVDRPAEPQPVRVVGHRCDRRGHQPARDHRRHVPTTVRIHPAIIAQAAATSGVIHQGRFSLGVGTGEALNEHILGDRWPEAEVRLEMLEEAVEVIRLLWHGGQQATTGATTRSRTRASTTCPPSRRRSSSRASARRRSTWRRRSVTGSARPRPRRRRSTGTAPRAARVPSTPERRSASWTTPSAPWRPSCGCGRTRACRASSPRSSPPPPTSSRPASSSPASTSPRP